MSEHVSTGLPSVAVERYIPAPRQEVFAAWVDADLLARWMTPTGVAEVKVEARVGGRLHVVMIDRGVRIEHQGEFLEIEPPERLRFTWSSPFTGGFPIVVTVTLAEEGDGTRLRLVHAGLPEDVGRAHAGGWSGLLDRLSGMATSMRRAGTERTG